ncbi:hypothetical protein BS47DRAFT_1356708 [Hydnum rufescens UP504]|uniref:Helicase C-terminal domain-containing protein n=1 Tax=Hydnum rufescens UP504 TaxID=1448309 RepID=A0A9P6AAQ9_9AGAM|nr:hypothetical protein BS47DRAFT_1356708 [Hydnum rufescens UP504]
MRGANLTVLVSSVLKSQCFNSGLLALSPKLTPEFSRHGEMARKEHDAIMAEFRGGSSRVLIATEVSARGIEVEQS